MRIKNSCLLLVLLVSTGIGYAQQKEQINKWHFHSINQLGLLQGEDKPALLLQTINGFERNNFFFGAGVGFDYYRYKTIPLFGDIRKYFGQTPSRFFVYGNGDVNFTWSAGENAGINHQTYYPGFYGDAGVGWKVLFRSGMGLLASAGYSHKRVTEKQTQEVCPFAGPCFDKSDEYRYDFNRIAIKIGWQF